MEVTTALLCDFAQVRDRLLFVSSGGVTRLWRSDVPTALGLYLAVTIELDRIEAEQQHDIDLVIVDQDGHESIRVNGNFAIGTVDIEPGELISLPVVFDLTKAPIRSFGPQDVRMYLDGQHRRTVQVHILRQPRPPAAPGPAASG